MNLSDNLKKLRKDNNLSQEQLAEKLGVSRQSVSKWESGLAYPEMDKVLQICQMFNLNVDELLNKNIKEVKEAKEQKVNVNKFIDDFLSFITRTIDMFSSMKFKDKLKCLFEQIIVCGVLALLFLILESTCSLLISRILDLLPYNLYYFIYNIIQALYIVFAVIAGVGILLHIFKVRYLDYYVIVKCDIEEQPSISSSSSEENLETIKIDEKKHLEKKQEKIIIRDPKHSQYKFISGLLKSVLFIIKLFAIGDIILFSFTLVFLTVVCIFSFLIIKTGMLFVGILIVILSSLIVNLILLYILYNFIFNKKTKKNRVALILVISLILIGVGIGFITIGITPFNYIDDIDSKYYIEDVQTLQMRDDLIIDDIYFGSVEYIESDSNDVKIVCKHSKYYEFEINNLYKENIIYIHFYENRSNLMDQLRASIDNINNKQIVDYSKSKVYVYASKDNIEKLQKNWENYIEQQEQSRIQKQLNEYENTIYELEQQNYKKEDITYELQEKIEEKDNEIRELQENINNYIIDKEY